MKKISFATISLLVTNILFAATLRVGDGQTYSNLMAASAVAAPGDTILIHNGVYTARQNISNLQGNASAGISIIAETKGSVIWQGGNEAWHLTDVAYLRISGFVFEQQKINGVNIDDGGSYETPSHHITIENCIFRDMDASGNNDLLKLSGLDDFVIRDCEFLNGSDGGSGVDMVGCHRGLFTQNRWENMGSNCIQAKGGTRYLQIERNWFENGGARALNLGGSTGLQFFRPIDAPFEAADIIVNSNVIIGADAAVSYTGSVRVDVSNNTIYLPERWVFRILQETVDTTRFAKCGNGRFNNNIVVVDNNLSTTVNVGSNTAPESFEISNNLWYNKDISSYTPSLPVMDSNAIVGSNPGFVNEDERNFDIVKNGPAVGRAKSSSLPELDYRGRAFNSPGSIGAFEGNPKMESIFTINDQKQHSLNLYPNPSSNELSIQLEDDDIGVGVLQIFDLHGRLLFHADVRTGQIKLDISQFPDRFVVVLEAKNQVYKSGIVYRK